MKLFIEEDELEEVSPIAESYDNALTIGGVKKEVERHSELVKEITAIDAIDTSIRDAGSINGVSKSAAQEYANGNGMKEETRVNVLSYKHEIRDKAVAKLMDTLDLLNPHDTTKVSERLQMVDTMSKIVDRISSDNKEGKKSLVLHLHMPQQNKESDYKVIDA